jgi:hypothetical protein
MSSPQNFTFNRYTLTLDRPGIVLPAELIFHFWHMLLMLVVQYFCTALSVLAAGSDMPLTTHPLRSRKMKLSGRGLQLKISWSLLDLTIQWMQMIESLQQLALENVTRTLHSMMMTPALGIRKKPKRQLLLRSQIACKEIMVVPLNKECSSLQTA